MQESKAASTAVTPNVPEFQSPAAVAPVTTPSSHGGHATIESKSSIAASSVAAPTAQHGQYGPVLKSKTAGTSAAMPCIQSDGSGPEVKASTPAGEAICKRCRKSLPGISHCVAMCKFCEMALHHLKLEKPLPENLELQVLPELGITTTREIAAVFSDGSGFRSPQGKSGSPSELSNPRIMAPRKVTRPQFSNTLTRDHALRRAAAVGQQPHGSYSHAGAIYRIGPEGARRGANNSTAPLNTPGLRQSNVGTSSLATVQSRATVNNLPMAGRLPAPQSARTSEHIPPVPSANTGISGGLAASASTKHSNEVTPPASSGQGNPAPPAMQHAEGGSTLNVFNPRVDPTSGYVACESCGSDFKPLSRTQAKEGLCVKCLKIQLSCDTRKVTRPVDNDDDDEAFADKQCKFCDKDYPSDTDNSDLCPSCRVQMKSIIDDFRDNAFMASFSAQTQTNNRDITRSKQKCQPQSGRNDSGSDISVIRSGVQGANHSGSHRVADMGTVVQASNSQLKKESVQILDQMDRLAERESIVEDELMESEETDSEDPDELDLYCSRSDSEPVEEPRSSGAESSDRDFHTPDGDCIDDLDHLDYDSHSDSNGEEQMLEAARICEDKVANNGASSEKDIPMHTQEISTQPTHRKIDNRRETEQGIPISGTEETSLDSSEVDTASLPKPATFNLSVTNKEESCNPCQIGPKVRVQQNSIGGGKHKVTLACTHCGEMKGVEKGWQSQLLLCTHCGEGEMMDLNAKDDTHVEETRPDNSTPTETSVNITEHVESDMPVSSAMGEMSVRECNTHVTNEPVEAEDELAVDKSDSESTLLDKLKTGADIPTSSNFDDSSNTLETSSSGYDVPCNDQAPTRSHVIPCGTMPCSSNVPAGDTIPDEALLFLNSVSQKLNENHEVNQVAVTNFSRAREAINLHANDMIREVESQQQRLLKELDAAKNESLCEVQAYRKKLENMVVLIRNGMACGSEDDDGQEILGKLGSYLQRVKDTNDFLDAPQAPQVHFHASPLPQNLGEIEVIPANGDSKLPCDNEHNKELTANDSEGDMVCANTGDVAPSLSVPASVRDFGDEESVISGDWDSMSQVSGPVIPFPWVGQRAVPPMTSADRCTVSGDHRASTDHRSTKHGGSESTLYTEWHDDAEEERVCADDSTIPLYSVCQPHNTSQPLAGNAALHSPCTDRDSGEREHTGGCVDDAHAPTLSSLRLQALSLERAESRDCDASPLSEDWDPSGPGDEPFWKFSASSRVADPLTHCGDASDNPTVKEESCANEGSSAVEASADHPDSEAGTHSSSTYSFFTEWQDEGGSVNGGLGSAAAPSEELQNSGAMKWGDDTSEVIDNSNSLMPSVNMHSKAQDSDPEIKPLDQEFAQIQHSRPPPEDVDFVVKDGEVFLNF